VKFPHTPKIVIGSPKEEKQAAALDVTALFHALSALPVHAHRSDTDTQKGYAA